MVIVGAAILPHGHVTFDGNPESHSKDCRVRNASLHSTNPQTAEDCEAVYQGCLEVSQFTEETNPDLIILHTPHGIDTLDSLGIYMGKECQGNALWNDTWDEIEFSSPMDNDAAVSLLQHLKSCNIAATGIRAFSASLAMPLRWGEVIPFWFLTRGKSPKNAKVMIISQSDMGEVVSDECLHIGKCLYEFAQQLDARVFFAVGGDLSHRHPTDVKTSVYLPHPDSREAYMPCAEAAVFDSYVENWVLSNKRHKKRTDVGAEKESVTWNPEDSFISLSKAIEIQPTAISCGMKGFAVLHGLLDRIHNNIGKVTSTLIVKRVPIYFGMMAVTFSWDTSK